jgi:uncharacterized protein YecE (DUF72 family)
MEKFCSRLKNVKQLFETHLHHFSYLEHTLGTPFLQLHDNFSPKEMERIHEFVSLIPPKYPMAIEFRHTLWHNDPIVSQEISHLFQQHQISHVLVDTAGRRDLLHMRLTTPKAFVRYVGANHTSDYSRLDQWVERIQEWKVLGLEELYFFIHQNVEEASPLLSAYFIDKLNDRLDMNLHVPMMLG